MKQRRSVVTSLLGIVSVMVCIVSAIVTQYLVSQGQIGHVSIKTDEHPLIVEVLDDENRSVAELVTLPSSKPISLRRNHRETL